MGLYSTGLEGFLTLGIKTRLVWFKPSGILEEAKQCLIRDVTSFPTLSQHFLKIGGMPSGPGDLRDPIFLSTCQISSWVGISLIALFSSAVSCTLQLKSTANKWSCGSLKLLLEAFLFHWKTFLFFFILISFTERPFIPFKPDWPHNTSIWTWWDTDLWLMGHRSLAWEKLNRCPPIRWEAKGTFQKQHHSFHAKESVNKNLTPNDSQAIIFN